MYHLHCFFTQNSMKVLYVAEALGCNYEFHYVDLMKADNHQDEFKKISLTRKVPLLVHKGVSLFESGAIIRYLATVENSPLYPHDAMPRAQVDQWLDFFVNHPGRWLTSIYYQKIIKPKAGIGEPDAAAITEAENFANAQLKILERWLADHQWMANDAISIADISSLAYMEQVEIIGFDLENFPNVKQWYQRLLALDSTARARAKVAPKLQAIM